MFNLLSDVGINVFIIFLYHCEMKFVFIYQMAMRSDNENSKSGININ